MFSDISGKHTSLMKKLLFVLLAAAPLMAAAQQPVGDLTVFSEDGDPFFLVLNGERQNANPQTNIRIEDLNSPYYNAKIIFQDKSILDISKGHLAIADVDGILMDVTYKIRKDKQGARKLNYFSSIPVVQDYIPPAGLYVHRFGQPMDAVVTNTPMGTVTQTTVTTTGGNGMGANVSVGGMNMNVSVNDPNMTTHTTTTTTYSNTDGYGTPPPPPPSHSRHGGCDYAMAPGDFTSAKQSISSASFEDTKLSTAKSIVGTNCLTADQVGAVCRLFTYEQSKLDFAKFAYGHTVDAQNYFKINNVFTFDASRDELSQFISSQ